MEIMTIPTVKPPKELGNAESEGDRRQARSYPGHLRALKRLKRALEREPRSGIQFGLRFDRFASHA